MGLTRGQAGVNVWSTWVQPGVNIGQPAPPYVGRGQAAGGEVALHPRRHHLGRLRLAHQPLVQGQGLQVMRVREVRLVRTGPVQHLGTSQHYPPRHQRACRNIRS